MVGSPSEGGSVRAITHPHPRHFIEPAQVRLIFPTTRRLSCIPGTACARWVSGWRWRLLRAVPGSAKRFFRQPRFHLDKVMVRGVDLTGGNLDLVVHVANPNR